MPTPARTPERRPKSAAHYATSVPKLPRLRYYRENKALTQRELAEIANITITSIRRIEHQAIEPRMTTVRRLADALGVTPAQLMGRES